MTRFLLSDSRGRCISCPEGWTRYNGNSFKLNWSYMYQWLKILKTLFFFSRTLLLPQQKKPQLERCSVLLSVPVVSINGNR